MCYYKYRNRLLNKIFYLDLDKAFRLVKCRVTRDELCLIYTILNREKRNYVIKCVKLTPDYLVYLIYMKN